MRKTLWPIHSHTIPSAGPSKYSDGSDLIELVCQGKNHTIKATSTDDASDDGGTDDDDEEPPDCSMLLQLLFSIDAQLATVLIQYHSSLAANFRVFVLRKASVIVSVAAVRAHGILLAEVPFIATREGYRREGHCRRLLDALEAVLWKAGVKWIALPAVNATVKIWMKNFDFKRAGYASLTVSTTCYQLDHSQPKNYISIQKRCGGGS